MTVQLPPCPNPKVPEATVSFTHSMPLQVRFSDIDMLGHINNSVYLTFMDLGKATYLTALNGRNVQPGDLSLAIVNINCDFYSPGYFDEPLAVATTITRLSNKSLTLEQRIYNIETGDVKCIGRTVMAGFDPRTASGIEIPAPFAAAILAANPHLPH